MREYIKRTSVPCCLSDFSHQAHTSPKSGTVAVALPNQSLALSITRCLHKTLATVHTTNGYPWFSSARPSLSFSSTLAVSPTPPSTIAGPRRSTPAAARKGSFGLYGLGPGSLFHPEGFGPEVVVPRVGLTCFVEQCTGFDVLPSASSSRLVRIQRVGSLGQDLIPAANEARAAVLLDCC